MNNKYDIEMGIDRYSTKKVKGRYDDENVLVDIPLKTNKDSDTWKNTFKKIQKSLVKRNIFSNEYVPVNVKIKKNSILPRTSKCDNCIIS